MQQFQLGLNRNITENSVNQNTNEASCKSTEIQYEVEKLLAHKIIKRQQSFLIRWKNFNSTYGTWELKENFNCPKLLQNYLKSNNLL